MNIFDVRKFGARGDGITLDSAAIQAAVNAAHQSGGGRVYCGPGTYLTGSIELKSNVTLYLEAGATLRASTRQQDYDQSWKLSVAEALHPHYNREHLIFARKASNLGIIGPGEIDGQAERFHGQFDELNCFYKIAGWRPYRLLAFIECRNVRLEEITIKNAPGWTVWLLGCRDVSIRAVRIFNHPQTPNSDGIDLDCCRGARVSDCLLECGDDCIALKSSANLLAEPTGCENVAVSNCLLRSSTCGVRLGYEGDAPIRNCVFSNLVMYDTRTGINMLVPRHEEVGIYHGPQIEHVSFSNIVMETKAAFYLWIGNDAALPGGIRDVSLNNITATTERGCYFGGSRSIPLEGIRLRGVQLRVRGHMDDKFVKEVPYPYRIWDYFRICTGIPHALYFRDARDVRLEQVEVKWENVSGFWQTPLATCRVTDFAVEGGRFLTSFTCTET
ncbi:MAG: glycoside hydrolase family 28 protein [Kiritimatiellia bacterium]